MEIDAVQASNWKADFLDEKPNSKKPKAISSKACPECGTDMRRGRTTLHFERGGFYADVENVNAMLCSRCGPRSVPGKTALKISDAVEQLFRARKDPNMTGISVHKLAS